MLFDLCFEGCQEFYRGRRRRKGHLRNYTMREQGTFREHCIVLKSCNIELQGKHGRNILILSPFLNCVLSALMKDLREFSGGPVVRTACFHHRGYKINPWWGNWDPTSYVLQSKKKKKNSESQIGHGYRPFYDPRTLWNFFVINTCGCNLPTQFFSSCYILSNIRLRDHICFYSPLNFQ